MKFRQFYFILFYLKKLKKIQFITIYAENKRTIFTNDYKKPMHIFPPNNQNLLVKAFLHK